MQQEKIVLALSTPTSNFSLNAEERQRNTLVVIANSNSTPADEGESMFLLFSYDRQQRLFDHYPSNEYSLT